MVRREGGNADAHNLLGFSYRKSGDFERALRHYGIALGIDPGHKGAHEYIGEAYLETGDLAAAEEHLRALAGLCPSGCEELADLERAVRAYKRKHRTGS